MMTSLELMRALLATALAGSAAMAVVLALRGMVRRRLGASAAYLLWLAWHAACRAGKTELRQFAQFMGRVEDFEVRSKEAPTSVFDDDDPEGTEAVFGERPTSADQPVG